MGQWGALGYALAGWTYTEILSHYYGVAASGPAGVGSLSPSQEATQVRVALVGNDGNSVLVSSTSAFAAGGVHVAGGGAAELVPVAGRKWNVFTGKSCAGPWAASPAASGLVDPEVVPSTRPPLGSPLDSQYALSVCLPGGAIQVQGSVLATYNSNGSARTVNVLPLEDYVAGVVPNESPAYWGSLGGSGGAAGQGEPRGFQELEVQAVAARSYVMSNLGGWGGYADICDTDCQVYRGLGNQTALSDMAVEDTAGEVVKTATGAVADTQYSSSTGGYTAGGDFAAVADEGDSVCAPQACNSHHTWSASIPVRAIEVEYPAIGTLSTVTVTKRNGYGDMGGRVESMVLAGSAGSVTVSGDSFESAFSGYGVQSNWFEVTGTPSGGLAGYWLAGADGAVYPFGDAVYYGSLRSEGVVPSAPVVAIAATPDGKGYWLAGADGAVYPFGDGRYAGDARGMVAASDPVRVILSASEAGGSGYVLVTVSGASFAYGDAPDVAYTGSGDGEPGEPGGVTGASPG